MSTIRSGNQPALVVVDVQVGVMADAWDVTHVVRNIVRAVEKARTEGVPVIWVQHESDDELPHGSPQWQLVPELRPAEGEVRIRKRFNSSFEDTALERELERLGVTHVVLAGAMTNWCIRSTAYAALDRGYDLTLIKDAHTTSSIALADGTKIEAAGIVGDLNVAMTWVDYPGRVSGTAAVDEMKFAQPGGVK
jgi:nicotinamidase-related amidase